MWLLRLYLRDRIVQLTLLFILALFVVSTLGITVFKSGLSGTIALVPMLGIAIISFELNRSQARSKPERHFWRRYSLAHGAWILGELLYVIVPSSTDELAVEQLNDLLVAAAYIFVLVALQLNRHVDPSRSANDDRARTLEMGGTVLFSIALLTYFSFIPLHLNLSLYLSRPPSMVLFVLFDVTLLMSLVLAAHVSNKRRWKIIYRTLAVASITWAVAHAGEGLSYTGRPTEGISWWSAMSCLALTIVIGAARFSREPFVSMSDLNAESSEMSTVGSAWNGQLVLYVFVMPVLHIGLSVLGSDDEATRRARQILVLCSMALFGTLALGQRRLMQDRRRLRTQPRTAEMRIRTAEETTNATRDGDKMASVLLHQRLEGLGSLAGRIAHDLNNLLTIIMGRASAARDQLPNESPLENHLENIETASKQAAGLTHQMLAYVGNKTLHLRELDLNRTVEEVVSIIRLSISNNVVLKLEFGERLPAIRADKSQLLQVVMNLATNASEAMGESQGTIWIRTGTTPEPFDDKTHAVSETAVFLEVSDTGVGIDDAVKGKLYEPFFTTKASGRGLGLAAVFDIMRIHSGRLLMESTLGKGSTFRALFPASRTEPIAETPRAANQTTTAKPNLGTILVIDDEETVRQLIVKILRAAGAQVLTAENGEKGLLQFSAHPEILAVVVDLAMPGMRGTQVARQMRYQRTDVPIVVITDYSDAGPLLNEIEGRPAHVLTKPIRESELIRVLGEALGC